MIDSTTNHLMHSDENIRRAHNTKNAFQVNDHLNFEDIQNTPESTPQPHLSSKRSAFNTINNRNNNNNNNNNKPSNFVSNSIDNSSIINSPKQRFTNFTSPNLLDHYSNTNENLIKPETQSQNTPNISSTSSSSSSSSTASKLNNKLLQESLDSPNQNIRTHEKRKQLQVLYQQPKQKTIKPNSIGQNDC